MLVDYPWPSYDESYIVEETVTIAIQVNGKLRDTVDVERDMEEEALKGLILSLEEGPAPPGREAGEKSDRYSEQDSQYSVMMRGI